MVWEWHSVGMAHSLKLTQHPIGVAHVLYISLNVYLTIFIYLLAQ
jgi:hypothetical protein